MVRILNTPLIIQGSIFHSTYNSLKTHFQRFEQDEKSVLSIIKIIMGTYITCSIATKIEHTLCADQ